MRRMLPLPLLLFVISCELPNSDRPEPDEMMASSALAAEDMRVVWEIVAMELGQNGYPLDQDASSPGRGTFESHWQVSPAPFRFDGRRKKVVGQIEEVKGSPDRFRVLLSTWVERNADLDNPMDPSRATWQTIEPDDDTTARLLYRIQRHF